MGKRSIFAAILAAAALCAVAAPAALADAPPDPSPNPAMVKFHMGIRIPLRDGVELNATAYIPAGQPAPAPCVFTLTPYIGQSNHDRGMYFAAHGTPFLAVDVRGRGDSGGTFRPMIQEAKDGYDVVEWLAKQPYCNGKVSMWGGSYAGLAQWTTAKERPPHLAAIVPVASPYAGVDFPRMANISSPYEVQWLTYVSGHVSQANIFGDGRFWVSAFRRWYESGTAFRSFDAFVGDPQPTFQLWLAHPDQDAFWDAYNPTAQDYAALTIPILTITGMYDGPGALIHYRNYMRAASAEGRARHFLVIGPWDHYGTRTPTDNAGGVKFGPNALVDLPKLHLQWYAWTMGGGPRPDFLKKAVAYYVSGADKWRYADSLEAVTGETRPFYLQSAGGGAEDVLASGALGAAPAGAPDRWIHDPRDVSSAAVEAQVDPGSLIDQTMVYAESGKQLVYHTSPFVRDTEISGFFRLSLWLAIDQPDTDFSVSVSEILPDGSSIPLSSDVQRARYRKSPRVAELVATRAPQLYEFKGFMFASRLVGNGSRLRLVVGPIRSIAVEKNYNSGGVVADETVRDARTVTVRLFHDKAHPSALFMPVAAPE